MRFMGILKGRNLHNMNLKNRPLVRLREITANYLHIQTTWICSR